MADLVDTVLERLAPRRREGIDAARLAQVLADGIAAGRRAWPQVAVEEDELAGCIGDTLAVDDELDVAALEELHLADLVLARMCTLGRADAIGCFRAHFRDGIESTLRQLGVRPSEVDEVTHLVLEEMLVHADPRPAAIAGYSGRGSLRRWVRSVALRIASTSYRDEQREAAARARLGDVMAELADDAELEHLRQQYTPAFEAAIEAAVGVIDVRDRNLLRHYFIDGLTIDDLASMHHVHRATAARWVGKARDRLYAEVLERLRSTLGLSPSEIASIGKFVRSQLDVSFSRLLG